MALPPANSESFGSIFDQCTENNIENDKTFIIETKGNRNKEIISDKIPDLQCEGENFVGKNFVV